MISNMLMVNDSKTEFLIVGRKQQLQRVNMPFFHVGEDQITHVMSVWNLYVVFDSNLNMDFQITKPAKMPTIISTTSGRSENPWAKKPRAWLYMDSLQASLIIAILMNQTSCSILRNMVE